MIFETHITGDKELIAGFFRDGLKTIAVDLLRPDGGYLRTEHMTSHIVKCADFDACHEIINGLLVGCDSMLIERVKIECPPYENYFEKALYMESHFESGDFKLPTSRNQRKSTFLATDRVYDKHGFGVFFEKYKDCELELCLFDTNIVQDADWMGLYGLGSQK